MILLGNFNSVVASSDRVSGNLDPTSCQLCTLLSDWGLNEPSSPHLTTFTYHHPSDSKHKSQIDHIYMNILSDSYYCYTSPVSFSDHYAMTLNKKNTQDKGPRPWRFPVSILSDSIKQQSIKDRLALFNEHNPIYS